MALCADSFLLRNDLRCGVFRLCDISAQESNFTLKPFLLGRHKKAVSFAVAEWQLSYRCKRTS